MKVKQIFRYGVGALILPLMWASVYSAEIAANDRAEIEEIIERYIASQGGRERIESLRRVELEGQLALKAQGIYIDVTQKLQTPDKVFVTMVTPGVGTVRQILNGDQGWEWHPLSGMRTMAEQEVKDLAREADLHRDLRLFEIYEQIRLGQPAEIEGEMTRHLILSDEDGNEEHWHFKENGDLAQMVRDVPVGPGGNVELRQRFYNFITVDGFRFPKVVRLHNPAFDAEITVNRLVINPEIDPAIFQKPEEP